jgi:ribonucleotide reductase beta subunit family protein with ferritin-like domain
MFPVKHQDIFDMYKKHLDCFWRVEEVDLSKDLASWYTLNEEEQHFISMILAFFAASDGIVMENLACKFMTDVTDSESRAFYSVQIFIENIHSEMYSLLIDKYIIDVDLKNQLFHAVDEFECVKKKADWALKWISNDDYNKRLVAFACVEGIFFSGAFCSIYWLKSRKLMPGLTFSNELISRDEALHTEFAVLLYSKLENKLNTSEIHAIVSEAVQIEIDFITKALPCKLIGMNSTLMKQYIEYVADRLVVQLGYEKIYGTNNPFSFMEMISIEGKTNFFEKRVGEYALANKSIEDMDNMFECDF